MNTNHIAETVSKLRMAVPVICKDSTEYRDALLGSLDQYEHFGEVLALRLLLELKRFPVDIESFMFGTDYLSRPRDEIYPAVLEELKLINNPNGERLSAGYVEGVFTGGVGSAKTTCALYTTAYQLYILSCFRDPHKTFKLDSTSEILFVFQSSHGDLAEDVDYGRFREICEQSFYFTHTFPFKTTLKKELHFPSRIQVKPIGSDGGSIGQNVIGGVIDEMNFMAQVQNSRKSMDGGAYNQALVIYNSIARRRMSRFMSGSRVPGILCLVSSKRYPGEFTDKKLEEAKTNPRIYVYDKRVWDIKPKGTYSAETFRVFHGDMTRKATLLEPDDTVDPADAHLVTEVPMEFKPTFDEDLVGAMRDIAGISTLARYPFLQNVDKITACFGQHESVFTAPVTDFVFPPLQILLKHVTNKKYPRWIHIDLGLTGDACGFAMGHVVGFSQTRSSVSTGKKELMPRIKIDGLLRIKAPKNDEIQFFKVRDLIYLLRDNGVNIKWVTFDSYQSVDSIQLLRQQGFISGKTSMDTSDDPYNYVKGALYDGRLDMPEHQHCMTELMSLEQDAKTGRIDHPPTGTKDVSDALAGVVWGLTNRRELWAQFGIPLNHQAVKPKSQQGGVQTPLENIR